MEKRFWYNHSHVYGWVVYDRQLGNSPAWMACAELLPPLRSDESGTVMQNCSNLENEAMAAIMCSRLNREWRRVQHMEKRFWYNHSHVYGWVVYDRRLGNSPAWMACAELLPPLRSDESGTVMQNCSNLENEAMAAIMCSRLNRAWRRAQHGA